MSIDVKGYQSMLKDFLCFGVEYVMLLAGACQTLHRRSRGEQKLEGCA